MRYSIEILLSATFLLLNVVEPAGTSILLINEPSNHYYQPYTLVKADGRIRRDPFSRFYPSDNPSANSDAEQLRQAKVIHSQCDQHIYTNLYSCSHFVDCPELASCLESIYCPLNIRSYGSAILNLLHLLGVSDCQNNTLESACPSERRSTILHNLLTYWTDHRINNNDDVYGANTPEVDTYCNTVSNFIVEVRDEVRQQCPTYSGQVEVYLENYLCTSPSTSTAANEELLARVHWANAEQTSRKSATASVSPVYVDEDKDLTFINSNKNLLNNTEQTVYVNDHQYYNVSYIVPKSEGIPINYVQDRNQFSRIHALSDQHRSAFSISLKFEFPFYGHLITKILVGTGGFIYTGDLLHAALIGSTQYIAPFMANFDVSIGGNQSEIKYFDNSTHFVCTWSNLYLQDQVEAGPFTFQAILQNTGNIYFNYLLIPRVKVSTVNHAHRIGLSDAYMSQHSGSENAVRVITLYDKLNLDEGKIKNGVSIVFVMDNTCNTFTDCGSCLANRGIRYNCSWCEDIQKCSDGYDRSRHQWVRAQCHRIASENTCPNQLDDTLETDQFTSPLSFVHFTNIRSNMSSIQHSAFYTFRTIVLTLLMTALLLSLTAFLFIYIYAYRHPTSPPGMWLLEHRPSNYIARFKRFSGTSDEPQ